MPPSTLLTLPTELILLITSHLALSPDTFSLRLTNKHLSAATSLILHRTAPTHLHWPASHGRRRDETARALLTRLILDVQAGSVPQAAAQITSLDMHCAYLPRAAVGNLLGAVELPNLVSLRLGALAVAPGSVGMLLGRHRRTLVEVTVTSVVIAGKAGSREGRCRLWGNVVRQAGRCERLEWVEMRHMFVGEGEGGAEGEVVGRDIVLVSLGGRECGQWQGGVKLSPSGVVAEGEVAVQAGLAALAKALKVAVVM